MQLVKSYLKLFYQLHHLEELESHNVNNQNNINLTVSSRTNQVTIPAVMLQNWQRYIALNTDPSMYSFSQKSQLSLAEYFYKLEADGRNLYHMTTTYKPYQGREYGVDDVNNFFKYFYTKSFYVI